MAILPNALQQTIFSLKAATGIGQSINVTEYQNIMLLIATSNSANFTVKIQGGLLVPEPTFSSVASITNPWTYLASYDYADPSSIVTGATGYSSAGTDVVKAIIVNVAGMTWLNCSITAYSAGNITVKAICHNNQ